MADHDVFVESEGGFLCDDDDVPPLKPEIGIPLEGLGVLVRC